MKHTNQTLALKRCSRHMLIAVLLACSACPLMAQEGLPSASNEPIVDLPVIVVTGGLWQSELQNTTASISVIDERSLASPEIQHFDDITSYLPNLTTTGGTSRARYIQIRGIGENSQFEGETPDAAVVFQIDDMDFTGLGSVGSLFDVKQVEVLRGPQAGAFGANAAGGMIHIVSEDPSAYWTGKVEATVGDDSLMGGMVAVGGPLLQENPETLTMRFALQRQQSDGFYYNETLRQHTNERDETAARLKLRWVPNENWQWDTTVFYANVDNGYDVFTMGDAAFKTQSNEPGRDEQESLGFGLKGKVIASDGYSFSTKTSIMQTDSFYSYDADWVDGSYAGYLATLRDREVFTQELRMDSEVGGVSRWTVGVYFQSLGEDSDILYRDGDPTGGEWDFGQVNVDSAYETETVAGFGQIDYELSDVTRLMVGLRYELHEVSFSSEKEEMGYYRGSLYEGKSENDDALFGGKITLEHDLSEDAMIFASIARGYKAGGANSSTFTTADSPLTYETETLWNVEAGLRGWWLDNRLSAQITGFYLKRDDTQLRDSVGAGGWFRYLTVNGDGATHAGVEAEIQWALSKAFSLVVGAGLLNAERDEYSDPGGVVPARTLANAPSYNYNVRLNYKAENGVFASVAVAGRGSYYESNSHSHKRDAMTLVNASAGYQFGQWKWSVWAKNLLDNEYASRVFFFDNGDGDKRYEMLADPMQIGTTLSYQF